MNEIKKIRVDMGLTQREFADKLGVTQASVASYESGRFKPSVKVKVLLARLAGKKPSEI